MSGKYPQLQSDTHLGAGDHGECEACDKPATHSVRVAEDYMRGNDDFYRVCPRHLGIARSTLGRFLAHVATKDKFVKGGAS